MLTTVQTHLQRLRLILRRWSLDPLVHAWLKALAGLLAGFVLAAASLSHEKQPFALGLICALTGKQALLVALGSGGGYLLFWGETGMEGALWSAVGLVFALTVGRSVLAARTRWLMTALAGVATAVAGLWAQSRGLGAEPVMFFLRIGLAMASAGLFSRSLERRDAITDWLVLGIAVLAFSQLGLGFPAAAAICSGCAFPAAALAGLALDLAEVTPVPMSAVLSLAWLVRFLPGKSGWRRALAPAVAYGAVMALTGRWELSPLPGMVAGGLLGLLIHSPGVDARRRGETGVVQVRLELTAEVYRQMQQQLLELTIPPVDERALLVRACERACDSCSFRKSCTGKEQAKSLSTQLLNLPIMDSTLHFSCRRTGRLLQELRKSQEQLRLLRASRLRQEESRLALIQQYSFLSRHLQSLSDGLCRRAKQLELRYEPEVAFGSNRSMAENGDRCLRFPATEGRYYVAVLDGMGTGIGAADEAEQAGTLLKNLLASGFPAEHALSSLNSLCALRGRAGAVTVDLVELELDSGRASVYKWGAPPSWLIRKDSYEKVGTAGPPPGMLVADTPETAQRLSLRRGEILLLLSDGVSGEDALCAASAEEPLEEQIDRILPPDCGENADDATVVLIRLRHRDLSA